MGTEQDEENPKGKGLEQGLPEVLLWGRPGMLLQELRKQCGKRDGSGGNHSISLGHRGEPLAMPQSWDAGSPGMQV